MNKRLRGKAAADTPRSRTERSGLAQTHTTENLAHLTLHKLQGVDAHKLNEMRTHKLVSAHEGNECPPHGTESRNYTMQTYSSTTAARLKSRLHIAISQNEQQETTTGFIDRSHSALAEWKLGKSKKTTLSGLAVGISASQHKVQLTTTLSLQLPRSAGSDWGNTGCSPACNKCTRQPGCPRGLPVPQRSETTPPCRFPRKGAVAHVGRGSDYSY